MTWLPWVLLGFVLFATTLLSVRVSMKALDHAERAIRLLREVKREIPPKPEESDEE